MNITNTCARPCAPNSGRWAARCMPAPATSVMACRAVSLLCRAGSHICCTGNEVPPMTQLRALLFNLCYFTWTIAIHVVCLPILIGPRSWTVAAGRVWIHVSFWLLRLIVGLDHRAIGIENVPTGPAIIAVKHQSAWETLYLSLALHHPAFVLKRELIWIPLFGWYLKKVGMIAIDRSAKAAALKA